MKKFCSYCGSPLNEDDYCNCRDKQNDNLNFFSSLFNTLRICFRNPNRSIPNFVKKNKNNYNIGFIIIYAILSGISAFIQVSKVNFSGNSIGLQISNISFTYGITIFLTQLITSVLLGLYIMVISTLISNVKLDYVKAFSIASIRSISLIPFAIIAIVLSLIHLPLGNNIISLGEILSYLFIYIGFNSIFKDNKYSSYAIFFAIVLNYLTSTVLIELSSNIVYGHGIFF